MTETQTSPPKKTHARTAMMSVRLSDAGLKEIDKVAASVSSFQQPSRSDIVRALLSVALADPGVVARTIAKLKGSL